MISKHLDLAAREQLGDPQGVYDELKYLSTCTGSAAVEAERFAQGLYLWNYVKEGFNILSYA